MIVGAPFDGGTTFRPGARFGPRGVRDASALSRGFHPGPGVDVFDVLRCADGGDIACVPMDIFRALASIEARVSEITLAGALPAMVGGDHSCTLGALRALAKVHGPLGLIHFDAHSDTYPPAWEIDPHHGTVFRNAYEEGLLRPGELLQVGVRGPFSTRGDLDWAESHGFEIISSETVHRDLDAVISKITSLPTEGLFYLSFDVDALDPSMAPGTGTPVPGGIFSWQALALVRAAATRQLVGCDVMEISPDLDFHGLTSLLGVTVLSEILAGVALQRSRT